MNMIRRSFIAGFAIAAMVLCTSSAKAQFTYGTSYAATGSGSVTITDTTVPGFTSGGYYDQYGTTLATSSGGAGATPFISYCVDISHSTAGYTALDTPALPIVTAFPSGTTVGTDVNGFGRAAWIADTYGIGATGVTQAAVQIAIWKAEYETTAADYANLGAGFITFTGDSYGGGALTAATTMLNASLTAGSGNFAIGKAEWVNYYDSDGSHAQFQLIPVLGGQSNPVPEPSTLAIAGLGALGFVGYSLRRRKRA